MSKLQINKRNPDKSKKSRKGMIDMKLKSIVKLFSYSALAAMMMLGTTLTTLAYSSGTPDTPADAAITKRLKMPKNTIIPADAIFTFTFSAVGKDGGTDTTGMPAISPVVADLTSGAWIYTDPKDGGIYYAVKETPDFIVGITTPFPAPGIYTYQVTETPGSISITDGINEGATYSNARYDIELWVEEDENKPGTYYVKFVDAKTVTNYIDEYYPGDTGGSKVDPTPGGVKHNEGTTIEDDFSQVIFTNSYWKSGGGGTDYPKSSALEIVKVLTGNGVSLTDRFLFDVTVTQPSIINPATPKQTYQACVMNADGKIITTSTHYAGTIDGNGFFTVTSDEQFTVSLAGGERLVFVDLHVGSNVQVTEAANANYKAKYVRTFAGKSEFTAPDINTAWGFPRASGTNPDDGPHYILDGSGANIVTFTNIRTGATPTGIRVNELPYIVLLGLAIAGLASLGIKNLVNTFSKTRAR